VYKIGELFVYVAVAILSSYRMSNKSVHALKQGTRELTRWWRQTGGPIPIYVTSNVVSLITRHNPEKISACSKKGERLKVQGARLSRTCGVAQKRYLKDVEGPRVY
jgi:hypothetical protein